jgi:hypothetical protein
VPRGKRPNKYVYLHVLQGHYGYATEGTGEMVSQGWEDLCASESFAEVRANLRDYRENEGGRYRLIQRREPRVAE